VKNVVAGQEKESKDEDNKSKVTSTSGNPESLLGDEFCGLKNCSVRAGKGVVRGSFRRMW